MGTQGFQAVDKVPTGGSFAAVIRRKASMVAHPNRESLSRHRALWAGGLGLIVAALLVAGWQAYASFADAQVQARTRVIEVMEDAMRQDEPAAYRRVVALAGGLSPLGPRARAMRAYAATVLAIEHQDVSMRPFTAALGPEAPELQAELTDGASEGFWSAAKILILYGQGDVDAGERLGDRVLAGSERLVLAKLEALRLLVSAKRPAARIHTAAELLAVGVSREVRALSYLGVWALSQNNTSLAEQYFHRAIGVNPRHTLSLLGLQYVRLSALTPEPGAIWQAHRGASEVLQATSETTTPPLRAMALLLRAQAFEREGNAPRAQVDRNQAYQLDSENLLHDAARDAPARP